jgi:hypothetical protein
MAWDRQYLKDWIKDRRLMPRDKDDGRLPDSLINDAINDSLEAVGLRCSLIGNLRRFPLVADQWQYPMDDDVWDIRSAWYISSSGNRQPLAYISSNQLLDWRNPATDVSNEPIWFSYPHYQGRVLQFWAGATPVYDYIDASWVTASKIRTVEDSGVNFGKILDGTRIKPGDVVHNPTDDSYGYVEVLDTITNTTTGTATSGTSTNTLENTGKDFTALNVEVGDVICTPSSGVVTGYAFVKTVGTDTVTYEDYYSSDGSLRFASGDTYKIGKAQKIRLSEATPHPGLREGATNDFTVGSVKATITGTTFTDTTVTGSSTDGAEEGDVAIASGGSHATVSGVDDNELTVDKWIGGNPSTAETVTVKECDKYQVETNFQIERVIWLSPTPSGSDGVGDESIEILCNVQGHMPTKDSDPIELHIRYKEPILAALEWKAAERAGEDSGTIDRLETKYETKVSGFTGDVYRPPENHIMTVISNRRRGRRFGESRYMTRDGWKWDVDI